MLEGNLAAGQALRGELVGKLVAVQEARCDWLVALKELAAGRARVRGVLINYTKALASRVPVGDLLLETMPRCGGPPRHTPDAVQAAAEWLPEAGKARLTWSASTDPLSESYQIRGCAGPEYDKDHEAVVGTVPGGGAREFLTDYALVKAGAEACFRVYVLLSTGNERAGTLVTVTR